MDNTIIKINTLKKLLILDILLIFIISIIISFPLITDKSILKTNDMSGNLINIVYIKKTLLEEGIFPQWNPFVNEGIPIVADPLNTFYNPLVLITFLLFPLFISLKLVYILVIFLSGLSFYFLLKYLNVERPLVLLSTFTFMSSGYITAQIFSGHLEKLLSYPLTSLFLLSSLILVKRSNIKWTGILAIILTLFVFSGAIYEFVYTIILLSSFGILYFSLFLIKGAKKYLQAVIFLLISFLLFIFFASIKILPLAEISPYVLHVSDPFTGSQSLIDITYNLFLPFKEIYTLFGINNFNPNFPYFWWESFAFIGILPLFTLFLIPSVIKKRISSELNIFIFLSFILVIFSMLGNWWNPFYWLFKYVPFLQQFRIPSRIFIFLIPVVLATAAITLNYFYKTRGKLVKFLIVALLLANFSSVLFVFNDRLAKDFFIYSPPVSDLETLLNHLKKIDNNYFLIGQSQFFNFKVPIYPAINNSQKIYEHNYGFVLKKSYSLKPDSYLSISPKYFIFPEPLKPPEIFTYKEIFKGGKQSKIYKNSAYIAYADIYQGEAKKLKNVSNLNTDIKKIQINPNKIDIQVMSHDKKNTLLVLESFAPGWSVKDEQGKKIDLLKNDFLNIPLEQTGKHEYIFTYQSKTFIIGFVISCLSFALWIVYIFRSYFERLLKPKNKRSTKVKDYKKTNSFL